MGPRVGSGSDLGLRCVDPDPDSYPKVMDPDPTWIHRGPIIGGYRPLKLGSGRV